MDVPRLNPRERVALDRDRLEAMCDAMGVERAEAVVGGAMEELAVWLSRCDRLHRIGNRAELGRLSLLMATVAARLGMDQLAVAARVVADASGPADDATLAAVTARMIRVGEGSLVAVWELEGLSV